MFHIEEVTGVVDHGELGVVDVLGEQAGVFHRGVFVAVAVDEYQRDVDGLQAFLTAVRFHVQYLLDVRVHLPVLVLVEGADMFVVEALEQRRQVLADGAVDQQGDVVAVYRAKEAQALVQVVEHRHVEDRREGADRGLFQRRRALGQGEQGGDAAPGEGHQVVGTVVVDQLEQDRRFVFLGDGREVAVVWFRLAGIGQVEGHHIELRLQVLDRLGERGGGRQRAIDQDDGLACCRVAVELRVYLVLPVDLDDCGFWPHVVSSWRK